MTTAASTFPRLERILACPVCKGTLVRESTGMVCRPCHRTFPQPNGSWVELLPPEDLQGDQHWRRRQDKMEDWYRNLIAAPHEAARCLGNDYAPYAEELATLSGAILDIGGGYGIPRHYLKTGTRYVVLEPSLDWLHREWEKLARTFPTLRTRPTFVRGMGEYLPFMPETFDAVLVFWALNHVSRPQSVIREAARVLRPGARLILVLEDMVPRYRDLWEGDFPAEDFFINVFDPDGARIPRRPRLRLFLRRLARRRWPLQSDHLRIEEPDLYRWSRPDLALAKRFWVMHFLTLVFEKRRRDPV